MEKRYQRVIRDKDSTRLQLTEEKLERHQAFLGRVPTARPLVGSWLFGFYLPDMYPRLASQLTPGPVKPEDISVDLYLEDVDALWQAYNRLDDDYPFAAGALHSVPWLEAIMGCPINFTGTTMWADPCLVDWKNYDWHRPKLDSPWARKLLEMLDALAKHSKGRFTCSPTLMRGMADMCAAMRGSSNLALDLYDCPENVRRLAELCADVWIEVGKAQLELIPESENGYVIGCSGLRIWFPQKGVWLQDDATAILSPRFYRELFLPQVRRVAAEFSHVAFHLHGNQLWPIDLLADLDEIDVLELNFDMGDTELDERLIPAWRRIQAKKPCLVFAHVTLEQLAHIQQELSPKGLSLQVLSPTMETGWAVRDLIYQASASHQRGSA